MARHAILQIGTEKTGTTTLQHFFAANRDVLSARGFLYPRFCGGINHTGLAAYALDPGRADSLRDPFGIAAPSDVPPMRTRMRAAAEAELGRDATAIFCNEHCHSRLTTRSEIETLRNFFAPFFDEIHISVYLRRQDQVALSLYSTRLKSGGTEPVILPRTNADDPYFNYDLSLSLWEEVFGAANIHPRLFDRSALVGGSIVTDFLSQWNLGEAGDFHAVRDQNESLRPEAQEYLRRVSPRLERIGALPLEEVRGPLAARLAQLYPGRGARPARADVERFYARFRPSNEAVRQRYFPDRPTLFDENFDIYPDVEDSRDLTLDDFAGIAARLHVENTAETRRLEAEIAIRDARLYWERKQPREAEAALRRALRWRPDHAEAYRVLAEYLMRLDRVEEAVAAGRDAITHKPRSQEYWHFLGIALRRLRRFPEAAEAQRKALELEPDHAAALRELAELEANIIQAEARTA